VHADVNRLSAAGDAWRALATLNALLALTCKGYLGRNPGEMVRVWHPAGPF